MRAGRGKVTLDFSVTVGKKSLWSIGEGRISDANSIRSNPASILRVRYMIFGGLREGLGTTVKVIVW